MMDLESLAVSAVKISLSKTDLLSPFINEKEKEPDWDGNVYIYSNKDKTKENIKRVPVQVKGTINNKQNAEIIKYPVEVSCLKSYLDDGGVMYFVVYIDETGDITQIYYAALLPYKIKDILSSIKDQSSVSIELKKFPDDKGTKTAIFLNFHTDMKRQTSFAHSAPISLEELVKNGQLESVTLSLTKCNNDPNDARDLIFLGDTYLYAKVKGSNVLQPIEAIPSNSKRVEEINGTITVNGQEFYNSYSLVTTKDEKQLWIGHSLYFSTDDKNGIIGIRTKPTTILQYALIDYSFILSLIEYSEITFNDESANIAFFLQELPYEKVNNWKNNYEYCKWLSELFDALRLDKNYDLLQMNDDDRSNSRMLYDAIICGYPISGIQEDHTHLLLLEFLNTHIPLIFTETDEPGTFYISDFFKDDSYQIIHIINGEKKPTSKFNFLTPENFLEIGNTDFQEIINSYVLYAEEPYCFGEANDMLLKMILAYDKSNDIRKDILLYAEKFALAIHNKIAKEDEKIISQLNFLQIMKRKNSSFSEEQLNWLISVAEEISLEDKNQEYSYRFGANLLLDNQKAANYYYKKLSKETQDSIKELPISRFLKTDMNLS